MNQARERRTRTLTPNQIVAHNLRRARMLQGWTQEAAATRLAPLLGAHWSKASFSAAERSVAGQRIRQFSADELVAFAAAFELPVAFFLQPPLSTERIGLAGAKRTLTRAELADIVGAPPTEEIDRVFAEFTGRLESMGVSVKRED